MVELVSEEIEPCLTKNEYFYTTFLCDTKNYKLELSVCLASSAQDTPQCLSYFFTFILTITCLFLIRKISPSVCWPYSCNSNDGVFGFVFFTLFFLRTEGTGHTLNLVSLLFDCFLQHSSGENVHSFLFVVIFLVFIVYPWVISWISLIIFYASKWISVTQLDESCNESVNWRVGKGTLIYRLVAYFKVSGWMSWNILATFSA